MTLRTVATLSAITSLVFGFVGLLAPQVFATALGVQFDATATVGVRLASASYLCFGLLDLLARDVTDAVAWRAIGTANAAGWALGAVVAATAIASGLGEARAWALVAMQVGFAAAWSLALVRSHATTLRMA